MKNHKELQIKITDFIRLVIKNSDDHDKKYMKIKFNSDYLKTQIIMIKNI